MAVMAPRFLFPTGPDDDPTDDGCWGGVGDEGVGMAGGGGGVGETGAGGAEEDREPAGFGAMLRTPPPRCIRVHVGGRGMCFEQAKVGG